MRLTADLINNSLSYLNPLKERELDLRGHKIPTIENLGVAGPQDAIDFTDNDLATLNNFPFSPRLNTLLCARNRIHTIDRRIADALPNLTTLMLANNNVRELGDLQPLRDCRRLTHLVLLENPIVKSQHYRHYLIWSLPSLRFLDYHRIRAIERSQAEELFGTHENPTELAQQIRGATSRTFEVGVTKSSAAASGAKRFAAKMTPSEKKRVEALINRSQSFAEIERIQKILDEGRIPPGCADADQMGS